MKQQLNLNNQASNEQCINANIKHKAFHPYILMMFCEETDALQNDIIDKR